MGFCTNPDSYTVAFYKSESLSPDFNTLEVPFIVFKTAVFPILFLFHELLHSVRHVACMFMQYKLKPLITDLHSK